jgi:plasmid stabilization system protein ParE
MTPITILDGAEADMASAMQWYDAVAPGLAEEFLTVVRTALDRVTLHPKLYQVSFDDVRAIPLGRFPYVVLYRALPNEVRVIGVLHSRRDPMAARYRAGNA